MAKVNVEQKIEGAPTAVYSAVKKYMNGRDTLQKLGAEVKWQDKKNGALIEADNFNGEISVVEDGKNSRVTISIDLPLLLSPFKNKVKDELAKHLSRIKV